METLSIPGTELVPLIKDSLSSGNDFMLLITGTSMRPFLTNHRDSVLLTAVTNIGIKKGVIVFMQRDSGEYVLHRVIKLLPHNRFLMNGDSLTWAEVVRNDQVFACVKTIFRKNRIFQYNDRFYLFLSHIWMILRPVRPSIFKLRSKIKRFSGR